jgi:hypothetical protein
VRRFPIFRYAREQIIDKHSAAERRAGQERRERTLQGLWVANRQRRRRDQRRTGEHHIAGLDWHSAHWLAAALLVMLLSVADALLTLSLLKHGATEANPIMAPLVLGNGRSFAFWKLGLTAMGVVVLVWFARYRLLGIVPAGVVLYLAACGYVILVVYEWQLLVRLGTEVISY